MHTNLKLRVETTNHYLSTMRSDEELSDWEGSDAGVRAMEDKIRLFGQDEVEMEFAPDDWAYQVVGIMGCGYTGVTKAGVKEALHDEGWTTTTWGVLNPVGGAVIPNLQGPSENTD